MAYKDGEDFTTYCDKPYDRHKYKMVMEDGSSGIIDDYELVRYFWYQQRKHIKTVIVIDCTAGKGF